MQSVAQHFPEVKCPGCPALIIRALRRDGEPVSVEPAQGRRGTIGLTASLFGNPPLAAPNQSRTRWKIHRCETAVAHSAASFDRKVRP